MPAKVIIVGATSGMGLALARLLVRDGASVGITGRRRILLEEIQKENPDLIHTACFDITESDNVSVRLDQLADQLGGLDLLVISAGYGEENPDLDYATEAGMIATNVAGFTAVADWAFNYFCRHQPGHIAAITSVAGIRGHRAAPAYFATKAYQIHYLESLRQRSAKEKIRLVVTDIRPGFVSTGKKEDEKLFWVATVDRAAKQIYRSIRRKSAVAYITRRWGMVAFLLRFMPRWLYNKL